MKTLKIAFDTSVLISAIIHSHPAHNRCAPYLKKVFLKSIIGTISSHCLAEIYSVLTMLPLIPKVTPMEADILLQKNIYPNFEIIPLSISDYKNSIQRVTNKYLSGGILYDSLHIESAIKSKASHLITMNGKDFIKLADNELKIIEV